MSLFRTSLSTAVTDLLASLPKGSYLHGIELTPPIDDKNRAAIMSGEIKQEIVVIWEMHHFETGLTVPVEYPAGEIKAKRLPKGCRDARRPKAVITPSKAENVPTVNVAPKHTAPVYLQPDEVDDLSRKSIPVEFMGIEPKWTPFVAGKDSYVPGYFYRKAAAQKEVTA